MHIAIVECEFFLVFNFLSLVGICVSILFQNLSNEDNEDDNEESEEPDYHEDKDQLEEEQEERSGEATEATTNQVFWTHSYFLN